MPQPGLKYSKCWERASFQQTYTKPRHVAPKGLSHDVT